LAEKFRYIAEILANGAGRRGAGCPASARNALQRWPFTLRANFQSQEMTMEKDPTIQSGEKNKAHKRSSMTPRGWKDASVKETNENEPLVTPDVGHQPDGQTSKSN
jgi:hypothetical protein